MVLKLKVYLNPKLFIKKKDLTHIGLAKFYKSNFYNKLFLNIINSLIYSENFEAPIGMLKIL